MAKKIEGQKFKAVEPNPKNAPVAKNLQWEGQELAAFATAEKSRLEYDKGTGDEVVVRFFEFGVNPKAFKAHKPTAQELFDTHSNGIKSMLWADGWSITPEMNPHILFSRDKKRYCIAVFAQPSLGQVNTNESKTLTEILK